MEFLKIIALCPVAVVAYGIAQDQVTIRVCLEYFTIGHPRLFSTESPTQLAIAWGVIATWWVGASLGTLAAIVSRVGSWPKRTAAQLARPLGKLLLVTSASAIFFGVLGYFVARAGGVILVEPFASEVPAKHIPFLAALWSHLAAYVIGTLGSLVICVQTLRARWRTAAQSAFGT